MNEKLALTIRELIYSQPYYGMFLSRVHRAWSDTCPTAGVSNHGLNQKLEINPHFWDSLKADFQKGVLIHEILHLMLDHPGFRERYPDKYLFNLAADCEINQYIDRNLLPGSEFSNIKEYQKHVNPIFKDIQKRFDKGKITAAQAQIEATKVPMRGVFIEDYEDGGKLEVRAGTDYYYKALQKSKRIQEMLQERADREGKYYLWGDHESWKEFEKLDEVTKGLLRRQLDYTLKDIDQELKKDRGTLPGSLSAYLDGLYKVVESKIPWKSILRMFIGSSVKIYTRKSRRKLSKRYPENPGLKIKPKKHILVAVDTSGSVSDTELIEFFNEIYHISKTGTEITVMQFDHAVQDIAAYNKNKKIKIHGRGGTSFDFPVDYFNEQRKFTSLVIFTDGFAPVPVRKPKGRTLWVITRDGEMGLPFPGTKLQLN